MEKCNPYSFYVVLADGIMEIPQDSKRHCIAGAVLYGGK